MTLLKRGLLNFENVEPTYEALITIAITNPRRESTNPRANKGKSNGEAQARDEIRGRHTERLDATVPQPVFLCISPRASAQVPGWTD